MFRSMGTVILSPHLDDAVLSCWHVLTDDADVSVMNVFAGVPRDLGAPGWWDEYTGATDSAERVRERIEEDRRALALAGREPINLSFLDEQYRERPQPLDPLVDQIAALLPPDAQIYAPAAFAGHTDHELVRAAALELRAAGAEVSLYADLPHATVHGWPAWVAGTGARAAKDVPAAYWERALSTTGLPPAQLIPVVHPLDRQELARKLAAVRMYATQLHALAQLAGRPLTEREALGYEVAWATGSPARAAAGAMPHP
jgi:LmbE family N-acetylglucosaminyl deacetylase